MVYKEIVLNLDFICNFNNFRVMKQRRGVSITFFKIDKSKCLFWENAETVSCANMLSPNDASLVNLRFK